MNAKIPYAIIAILFGFMLGVSFQYTGPEGKRELASKAPSAQLDLKVSFALKECLSDRVKDGHVEMSKVDVDGRNFSIVSIDCVGEKAKVLYDAVGAYSDEQYVRYSDGRRGVGRFFGRRYPPSQCVRVIRTAKGSELNQYSCSLMLDLDYDLIKSLKI